MLKPLVKRCDLLVTNDTGPRHYAVAFDVPVVVIMGPTDPRYTSSNLGKTTVIRIDLDCSPCHRKTCPTDHRCMTKITPEMVFEAGEKLLNEPK
jgi:heptosyltransferase-2